MSLFRWGRCRFCAILFAGGFINSMRAQTPSQQSEFRVFVGYENQRADLFPSTMRALNGAAISFERVTPQHAFSPLLDFRVGHRSALYFGPCELCPSAPTTPNARASNIQALLLGGVRASLPVRGARAFVDALAGLGYLGWSSDDAFPPQGKGLGSPLAEAGAGIDVPIGGIFAARARASVLASHWDGWRQHLGLSAGLVLRLAALQTVL